MSEKRRDKKNRVLRNGESQMPNGRYRYSYYENGSQKSFYSWKLTKTDSLPAGKRECVSLRDKEEELRKAQDQGIAYHGGELTVYQLAKKYVDTKEGVKANTKSGYISVLNFLAKNYFGAKRIDMIRTSDAKLWLISLYRKGEKGRAAISAIHSVLKHSFQMAVEDDLIVKNPFCFKLESIRMENAGEEKKPLTEDQERKFLDFIQNDSHYKKYYDAIWLLFHTGMRISEFCGLTVKDLDFKKRCIHIERQLLVNKGTKDLNIGTLKSKAAYREIPMTDQIYECCKQILSKREKPTVEHTVDGVGGFLFFDRNGNPKNRLSWGSNFNCICGKYNKTHNDKLYVTPHICRHTFCTNMAKAGMKPEILAYIAGHSDYSTTMNVYIHIGAEDVRNAFLSIAG